jgi:hypothetical protein
MKIDDFPADLFWYLRRCYRRVAPFSAVASITWVFCWQRNERGVPVDAQDVVPGSERLMGGW